MAKQEKIPTMNKEIVASATVVKPRVSLDDIISEYSKLYREIEESDEFTEELQEKLFVTEENCARKLLGYRYMITMNEATITSLYKPEIEKMGLRIKRAERNNTYFKEKVCLAAEIFGIDGKFKSDIINVISVETVNLDINDDLVKESIDEIKKCIIDNNTENITVETELVKCSLNINGSPEALAKIISFIVENEDTINYSTLDTIVALDRKAAKELVQEVEEFNEGIQSQYDNLINGMLQNDISQEVIDDVKKPNYRTIAFKGLSLKSSHFPRFS